MLFFDSRGKYHISQLFTNNITNTYTHHFNGNFTGKPCSAGCLLEMFWCQFSLYKCPFWCQSTKSTLSFTFSAFTTNREWEEVPLPSFCIGSPTASALIVQEHCYKLINNLTSVNLSKNRLCGRPPQYAPAPCKLAIDLLTLKVVSESRVSWATSDNFSLPRPLCSRLQTSDRRQTRIIA